MAGYVAGLANRPADQVADLARRAIASGPRPLRELAWFPMAIVALLWAEQYGEAQLLLDAAIAEERGRQLTGSSFSSCWVAGLRSLFGAATLRLRRPTRALFSMPPVCSLSCLPVWRRAYPRRGTGRARCNLRGRARPRAIRERSSAQFIVGSDTSICARPTPIRSASFR